MRSAFRRVVTIGLAATLLAASWLPASAGQSSVPQVGLLPGDVPGFSAVDRSVQTYQDPSKSVDQAFIACAGDTPLLRDFDKGGDSLVSQVYGQGDSGFGSPALSVASVVFGSTRISDVDAAYAALASTSFQQCWVTTTDLLVRNGPTPVLKPSTLSQLSMPQIGAVATGFVIHSGLNALGQAVLGTPLTSQLGVSVVKTGAYVVVLLTGAWGSTFPETTRLSILQGFVGRIGGTSPVSTTPTPVPPPSSNDACQVWLGGVGGTNPLTTIATTQQLSSALNGQPLTLTMMQLNERGAIDQPPTREPGDNRRAATGCQWVGTKVTPVLPYFMSYNINVSLSVEPFASPQLARAYWDFLNSEYPPASTEDLPAAWIPTGVGDAAEYVGPGPEDGGSGNFSVLSGRYTFSLAVEATPPLLGQAPWITLAKAIVAQLSKQSGPAPAPAAITSAVGFDFGDDAGTLDPGLIPLAAFSAIDPSADSNYDALIDWGDGSPPEKGEIIAEPAEGDDRHPRPPEPMNPGALPRFAVYGGHSYAVSGAYTVSVTITDATGASVAVMSDAAIRSDPCPDVAIIGIRGTGEPYDQTQLGMGPTVYSVSQKLANELWRRRPALNVLTEGVPYESSPRYEGSLLSGMQLLASMMGDQVRRCPNVKLVLIGLSQGADVIESTMAVAETPKPATDQVAAIILFGDPKRLPGQAYQHGTTDPHGGIFADNWGHLPAYLVSTSWAFCYDGDEICANHLGLAGVIWSGSHTHYVKDEQSVQEQGVKFAANLVYPATVSYTDVHTVDWRNVSVPAEACGTIGPTQLHDGKSVADSSRWPGFPHVTVIMWDLPDVAYGDLDGSGHDNAAVPVSCDTGGGTGGSTLADNLVVYSGANGLHPIGVVTTLSAAVTNEPSAQFDESSIRLSLHRLTAIEDFYAPNEPNCCPSKSQTDVWSWDGSQFTPHAGSSTAPAP